jgi:cysteinyl-tRNA synthetase
LDDDLNAPQALGAVWDALRDGNRLLDEGVGPSSDALSAWGRIADLLEVLTVVKSLTLTPTGGEVRSESGVPTVAEDSEALPTAPPTEAEKQDPWALAWARERKAAKARRDYKEADRIRDLLKAAGWEIRDNKDGSVEVRRA